MKKFHIPRGAGVRGDMRLGLSVFALVVAAFLVAGHYHRDWFVKSDIAGPPPAERVADAKGNP